MKRQLTKLICLVFVIALIFSISSCAVVDMIKDKFHKHDYVDGKCECGESDPDYVAPHTHNFVDGKCECGEEDPNYVPPTTGTKDDPHALTVPGTLDIAFAGGYEPIWYSFTASETKILGVTLSSANADMGYGISDDDMKYTSGKTTYVEVPIEAGVTYLVNFSTVNAEAGEYTVTAAYVDKVSPYEVVINEGKYNTVTFSAEEIEAGEATRKLVITNASTYMFKGDAFVSSVVAADGTNVAKNDDYSYTLEAGEYTLTFGMFSMFSTVADTGYDFNVENQEEEDVGGDDPVVPAGPLDTENSELVIGDNTITITDADIEEGAVTYTIVVTAAGTFTASSNDLGARFVNANNEMAGFGMAELTPGTYTVVVICAAVETAGDYTLTLEYTAPTSGGDDVTGGTEDNPIEVALPAENIATEGDSFNYLWYTFTSTDEGILTVTYSNANSWATFYMEGDEYHNQSGMEKQVITFEVQANSTYLLGLGVYAPEEGVTASLSFNAQALPKEGDFEKPFTAYAGDEFSCAYPGGNDATKFVWYKYDPWITGTLTITMGGRAIVKYGSDVENLVVATNQQTITLDITAYTPIYIAIQSSSLAEETITFSLEALEAPGSYDNAHDAVIGDNTGAVPSGAYDVFFDYYSDKRGTLTFTYTNVSVYVYFDWEWLLIENNGTLSVSEAETYKIKVADFAEDATTVSFSLAFEEASVEIEGELKETLTLVAPTISSMFANSEVQTFEAAAGTYQIDAEGVADLVNTNVQLYDAVDDSWIKLNSSLPYTIEVTEATTLQFRLSCWSTSDEGKNVVIKIYGTESEGGEEGGDDEIGAGAGVYDDPYIITVPGNYTCEFPGGYDAIWYAFTATVDGTVTLSTTFGVDGWLQIGTNPMMMEQSNEGSGESVSLNVTAGNKYYVAVGDWSEVASTVPFSLAFEAASGEEEGTGTGTDADPYIIAVPGDYTCEFPGGYSAIWYAFTATADGTVTLSTTFGADGWLQIGTNPMMMEQSNEGSGESVSLNVTAGNKYYVAVGDWSEVVSTVPFSLAYDTVSGGEDSGLVGAGVQNNPYIITESADLVANVVVEDEVPSTVYYAYSNSGEIDVVVTATFDGLNYFVQYGTYNFMLLDKQLNPQLGGSFEITVAAGATLFMTVSSYDGMAAEISFSVAIEQVEEEPEEVVELVMGSNSVVISDKNANAGAKECTFTAPYTGAYTFASNDVGVRIFYGELMVGTGMVNLEAGKNYTAIVLAVEAGTYTIDISADLEDLPMGNNDITGNNYYEYVAATEGTLSVGISSSATSVVTVIYSVNGGEENEFSSRSTIPSANIKLEAGDKVIIIVKGATNFSANFTEGSETVVGTPLAMGNNAISQNDIVYSYTAAEAGVLKLEIGGAVMGDVSVTYTVNGGESQALALNSSVELNLVAGDKVVITVDATGYSTITASFGAPSTDEGGDEEGGEDVGGGSTSDISGTYLSAKHVSGRYLKVTINTTAGTMTLIRSNMSGGWDASTSTAEYTYSFDGTTVTATNVSGQVCTFTWNADGTPLTIVWGTATFETFAKQ